MNNINTTNDSIEKLDINNFPKSELKKLTQYFNKYILPKIKYAEINKNKKTIKYCLNFDESHKNLYGDLYGGTVSCLLEGLVNLTICYFKPEHDVSNVDTNITFITSIKINTDMYLVVDCNKLGR